MLGNICFVFSFQDAVRDLCRFWSSHLKGENMPKLFKLAHGLKLIDAQGLWLVWKYQGDRTLAHYMKQKNFPENVAEYVLGNKVKIRPQHSSQLHATVNFFHEPYSIQLLGKV